MANQETSHSESPPIQLLDGVSKDRHYHHPPHTKNISTLSQLYKREIIHAMQELKDYHHRSNIDCIRRKTQSTMNVDGNGLEWNETMFLRAFKALLESGEIEKCNPGHISACELSPEMKKKVTSKAHQMIQTQQQQQQQQQLHQLYVQQQLQFLQEQYQLALSQSSTPPPTPQQQQQVLIGISPSLVPPQLSHVGTTTTSSSNKTQQQHQHRRHSFEGIYTTKNAEKEAAAKKTEHFKEKIIPKKIYDQMFVPIKNPMVE